MSQLLSALPVGALVKEPNFIYKGTVPIFRILEHGHAGDPSGSTTLECRDILTYKAFDAKEPSNQSMSLRRTNGNNEYIYSNLLQWLNSNAAANSWYTAQHQYDQAPSSTEYVYSNPYTSEAGFLSFFPNGLRSVLMDVTKPVTDVSGNYTYPLINVTSKIFLLSLKEVNVIDSNYQDEGTVYSFYSIDAQNKRKKANTTGAAEEASAPLYPQWFLRTPQYNDYSSGGQLLDRTSYEKNIASNGNAQGITCRVSAGVSPAFCIPSSQKVSDSPDTDGAYILEFNYPPTITPSTTDYGSVTSPPTITTTITDPDGDSFTYTVKLNGTTKASGSATGTKTFAIDTAGYWPLMALGTNTITVQATDSKGATASATYTMNKTNSAAPVPTTDLVNNTRKETSFYIGFQIGLDADGDSQTVVAQVSDSSDMSNPTEFSGVEKEVAGAWLPVQTLTNADVGARLRIQVTGQTVGDTIYVRLKDTDSGSGSPVYTSTYTIVIGSVLEFNTLPISRTDKPSLVVAYLNKTKPADATLAMYACNNANDGAPTWEPITEGETHQFTNKTKTAQNWAVSVKTSITAGATAGEISVSAVGLGVL